MKEDHEREQENEPTRSLLPNSLWGFAFHYIYPVHYKIVVDEAFLYFSQKDISEFPRHC